MPDDPLPLFRSSEPPPAAPAPTPDLPPSHARPAPARDLPVLPADHVTWQNLSNAGVFVQYDFANRPIRIAVSEGMLPTLIDDARREVHRRRAIFLARFPRAEDEEQGSLAGIGHRRPVPLIVIVATPPTERWGACVHCGDPLPANRGGGCTLCHLALFSALRMDGRLPGLQPGDGAASSVSESDRTAAPKPVGVAPEAPAPPAPEPAPDAPAEPDPPPPPEATVATSTLDEAIALLSL